MKKDIFIKVLLIALLGFFTSASAAATEPGSFVNYLNVFIAMAKGTAGILAIILILVFAGIKAWQMGEPKPFYWGALAAILIAVAPYMATNLTTNASTIIGL